MSFDDFLEDSCSYEEPPKERYNRFALRVGDLKMCAMEALDTSRKRIAGEHGDMRKHISIPEHQLVAMLELFEELEEIYNV